jgi:hypothetical protein
MRATTGEEHIEPVTEGEKRAAALGRGATLGLATGGPIGALSGAVGEGVSEEVRLGGGGELGAAGAGIAADIATGLAARNPQKVAGAAVKAGKRVARAVSGAPTPPRPVARKVPARLSRVEQRAKAMLEGVDDEVLSGHEGPDELSDFMRRKYMVADAAEDDAWYQWTEATRTADADVPRVSSRKVVRAAKGLTDSNAAKLNPDEIPPNAAAIPDMYPETISIEDAQDILHSISRVQRSNAAFAAGGSRPGAPRPSGAFTDPKSPLARNAQALKDAVQEALDEMARQSPDAKRSVDLLRKARAATAEKASIAPFRSKLWKEVVGPSSPESGKAWTRVFASKDAPAETAHLKKLVKGNRPAERALARTALRRMLERSAGADPALSAKTAGAALGRASAETKALRAALGNDTYDHVVKLLDGTASATYGNNRFAPVVRFVFRGKLGLIGDAANTVLANMSKKIGDTASYNAALEALVDRKTWVLLNRPVPAGKADAVVNSAIELLVRRGALDQEEIDYSKMADGIE